MANKVKGVLEGREAAEAMWGVVANAEGRCMCGAFQPDDVNWAAYELEVENVVTGDEATTVVVVCPSCEHKLDGQE